MKKNTRVFIALLFIIVFLQSAYAQSPLTAGEYFINTDPGEGNGTPLISSDGSFNEIFEEFNITLSTASLSEGVHTLYVRLKNSDGSWGKVIAKPFVVREESAFFAHLPPKLTNAEYFVDSDPGEGNGIALDVTDGNFDGIFENFIGTLNTSALSEGVHTLFVRFRNSDSSWGKIIAKPFVVREESAFFAHLPPKLTNAEYFVDSDPGEGNGINLKAHDGSFGQFVEIVSDTLKTDTYNEDIYLIGMRFLESNGRWSKPFYSVIEVRNITPPSKPTGLTATPRNRKAIIKWFKNPDHDIASYILYRSLTNNFVPDSTNLLAMIDKNDTTYTDKNLENGAHYYYRLQAVDVANLYSEASEQAEVIPFNTPPKSFALQSPANDSTLADITQPVKFIWQASSDIDEDSLYYAICISGANLDTTISNISDTTIHFAGHGLLVNNTTYSWFVNVTDGTFWTACIDTFIFITPGLGDVEKNRNALPSKFALHQNYPNPFNPFTVISYDIPTVSNVMLKVYDMLGREVATLVNEVKSPGTYEVQFDASHLASGIYFYKLTAGNFTSVKKLILMK